VKRILLCSLAAAMLLAAPRVCPAQKKDLSQIVTISFSGYDDLMKGVGMVGKVAGMPILTQMVEAKLQEAGMAEALNAIDKKQPWVVALKTDAEGLAFPFQVFVPTSDVKKVLKSLPPVLGEPADAGDGVLEIKAPDRSIFLKQQGAWAVISDKKDQVVDAPADPVKLAGALPEKYQLGVTVSVKSVPEGLRKKGVDMLGFFAQQAAQQRMPNESDEQFAARGKLTQQSVEQLKTVINDLDAITVGVKLDEATSSAYLEYVLTMVPDSTSAKKMAKSAGAKAEHAGAILPGAAVALHATQQLDPADIDQLKANFVVLRNNAMTELEKQGLPDEQAKLAKQLAGDLMDVVQKTLETGKLDAAASLKLSPKELTLVAGLQIADGGKLDSVIKKLIEQVAKDQPEAAKLVKLNAEEHSGVRFHVVSVPLGMIPTEEERGKISALVGENLDVVIGVGDTSLYLSAGRDAIATLKKAIDASKSGGKSLPPMEVSVAALPIAQFVAAVGDDNAKQGATMIAKMLESASGKDHVKVTAAYIPNGVQVRLQVEEGVLKALGVIPMLKQ